MTNTKINFFDTPITTDQKVFRFDVPMYNVLKRERLQNVQKSIDYVMQKLVIIIWPIILNSLAL
jgi:hypothetical protein